MAMTMEAQSENGDEEVEGDDAYGRVVVAVNELLP